MTLWGRKHRAIEVADYFWREWQFRWRPDSYGGRYHSNTPMEERQRGHRDCLVAARRATRSSSPKRYHKDGCYYLDDNIS